MPQLKEVRQERSREYYNNNKEKRLRQVKEYARSKRGRFLLAISKATRRGWEWSLSSDEYSELVAKKCDYCFGAINKFGIGLDRLDHKGGYVSSNVVPCCGSCNFIKGSLEGAGFVYPRTVELMRELAFQRF